MLGRDCAQQVVASGARIVVGHFNSAGAALALPVYAHAGLPCLLPLATAPGLLQLAPGLVLRECPTDEDQASSLLAALAGQAVAVIHDDSPYGCGLADQFVTLGATSIAFAQAAEWRGAVVVCAVHIAAAVLARELRGAGCTAQLAFVDDCEVPEFRELAGSASDGALVARFPGSARACVDTLVQALATAVGAAPEARGAALLEQVRAASRSCYDGDGERQGAAWEVVPVDMARP